MSNVRPHDHDHRPRVLATVIALAVGFGILAGAAPIGVGQLLLVGFGWALAYFGDEMAPLIGITSSPSTSQYVEPIIRAIGWLLLLAACALYVARIFRM